MVQSIIITVSASLRHNKAKNNIWMRKTKNHPMNATK